MRKLLENLKDGFQGEILLDEMMASYTSWKLGGPADLFLVPASRSDLQLALRLLRQYQLPWVVVGNGTNLLVSDRGVRGAVIQVGKLNRIEFLPNGMVEVEAGVQLSELIKSCCREGLGGLEELSGIPGMLGGALLMNAGALETEIGDIVSQVYLTDGQGEWALRRDQIDFGYRYSGLEGRGVISGARLQLKKSDPLVLTEQRRQVLKRRKAVQRVTGAHAGSVFKNPPGEKAWQLIDKAGMRGVSRGAAVVSAEHCNHIVNRDSASATDVWELIREVQQSVLQDSGIQLELEVRLIGWEE